MKKREMQKLKLKFDELSVGFLFVGDPDLGVYGRSLACE